MFNSKNYNWNFKHHQQPNLLIYWVFRSQLNFKLMKLYLYHLFKTLNHIHELNIFHCHVKVCVVSIKELSISLLLLLQYYEGLIGMTEQVWACAPPWNRFSAYPLRYIRRKFDLHFFTIWGICYLLFCTPAFSSQFDDDIFFVHI